MVYHADHDRRTLASIGVQEMSLRGAPGAPDHEVIVYTVLNGGLMAFYHAEPRPLCLCL